MKKVYNAPKSENVQLDPLMVTFDTLKVSNTLQTGDAG